jgi:hypothetical protein
MYARQGVAPASVFGRPRVDRQLPVTILLPDRWLQTPENVFNDR